MPLQQLFTIIKTLTPSEKAKLRAELNNDQVETKQQDDFLDHLLKEPIYTDKDLQIIEENRKVLQHGGQKLMVDRTMCYPILIFSSTSYKSISLHLLHCFVIKPYTTKK